MGLEDDISNVRIDKFYSFRESYLFYLTFFMLFKVGYIKIYLWLYIWFTISHTKKNICDQTLEVKKCEMFNVKH